MYFLFAFSPGAALWRRLPVAALPSYLIRFEIVGIPMTLLGMILILFAMNTMRRAPHPALPAGEGKSYLASPLRERPRRRRG